MRAAPSFAIPPGFARSTSRILLTHTILAVVIVPMVLTTLYHAARRQFDLHKKIARWTWPIWMYVSITGVLIYFLLYHIFPQAGRS